MKDIRHFSKKDTLDNRMEMQAHKDIVPKSKLSSGSLADKYPVILDDGRTVVYVRDKSREREIRQQYELKKI